MKKQAIVSKLIKAMCETKWAWERAFCKKFAKQQKPDDVDEVEGRSSYEFAQDVDLSIYFDDDDPKQVEFFELTTNVSFDPDQLSAKKYAQLLKDYTKKFEATVAQVQELLGAPAFIGGCDDRGHRDDHDAIRQAWWKIKNAVLIAALKHEDQELPMRNVIVLVPK